MTLSAAIFMIVSWVVITALSVWCLAKLVRKN